MSGLKGKIIISTCTKEKAKRMSESFKSEGAEVFNFPLNEINKAGNNLNSITKTLQNIDSYNLIIFTSTNGVKYFFYWLEKNKVVLKSDKVNFALIGKATGNYLRSYGIEPYHISNVKDSKEFANELLNILPNTCNKILIPTGNSASNNLKDILSNKFECDYLTVYNTKEKNNLDTSLLNRLSNKEYDYILFMSPSAVKSLIKKLPEDIKIVSKKCIALGNTTKQSLSEENIIPHFIPSEPNIEVLVNELNEFITII
ncbi:MAG: uroporphyrinogen-III synthase [Chlorobi bacterium]|nr:uroporphyrinogen-III synthase [Chlorobiota bacterium]